MKKSTMMERLMLINHLHLSTFLKKLYRKIDLGFKGPTLQSQIFFSTLTIQWKSPGELYGDDRTLYKNPHI